MKLILKYLLFAILFVVSSCGEIFVGFEDDELIHVSNSSLFFEADGGSETIYVRTYNSLDCNAECSAPWVDIQDISDENGKAFNIIVKAEPLEQRRVAEVILSIEGGYSRAFNVQQEPYRTGDMREVDLGLPSGVLWANCNVGALHPEDCGYYAWGEQYAWGEIEKKTEYNWDTYKWGYIDDYASFIITKYCKDSSFGVFDDKGDLDPEDDVAHVKWGGNWRMPTEEELQELYRECTWQWTVLYNEGGYRVTGPNGNSIFLHNGEYWSKSIGDYHSLYPYCLCLYGDGYFIGNYDRASGRFVRPVWDSGQSR